MAGVRTRLGNLMGPRGVKGDPGQRGEPGQPPRLTAGTTTQVSAGEKAEVTLVKTGEVEYRVDARVPKGLDGDPSGVADLSAAMASEINTEGSAPRDALNAASVGVASRVEGGIVPRPLRVPHLVVDDTYPSESANHNVVWAEPSGLMYAAGKDRAFYKSTDHGATWEHKSTPTANVDNQGIFLRLSSGTLLGYRGTTITRSTDDGVNWTNTHTLRANTVLMAPTAWCEDQHGHVYYGEYQTVDTFSEIRVYRSTDDGATFSVFHTFPGPTTTDPSRIRHVHGIQFDALSRRVFVMTGDSESAAGVYRTNASTGATGLEKVVSNADLTGLGYGSTLARSIGMMFFPTHIAWGADATANPYLVRLPRSEIGSAAPTGEVIYRLNATAWFATRASADGSTWVMCASKEGTTSIDNALHLYAVQENGERVFEVGSLPQRTAGASGSIAPVGKPEIHTDRMWLQSFNTFKEDGRQSRYQFAARLAHGAAPLPVATPPAPPAILAWQSVSSGFLDRPHDGTVQIVPIGQTRSGGTRRRLVIHDWCVRRSTGTGAARLSLYNLSTNAEVWTSEVTGSVGSKRSALGRDEASWIETISNLGASNALEWRVIITDNFTGNVQVTYAWID